MIGFFHFLIFFTALQQFHGPMVDDCNFPKQSMLYPHCNVQAARVQDVRPVDLHPLPAILQPQPVRWNDPDLTRRAIGPGALWPQD